MDNSNTIQNLHAVINTLGAANLRADQFDAIQRIHACMNVLQKIVADMEKETQEPETKEG